MNKLSLMSSLLLLNQGVAEQTGAVVAGVAQTPTMPATVQITHPETGDTEDYTLDPATGEYFSQGDGFRVCIRPVRGEENKGLSYHVVEWQDFDKMLARQGQARVLNEVNDALSADTRLKVKNSRLPQFDDDKIRAKHIAIMVETQPTLLSKQEALLINLGEREKSANQINIEIKKAIADGVDRVTLRGMMDQWQAAVEREAIRRGLPETANDRG